MSIIGLLDWDLTTWQQPTVFNIDLMKLAYYHKVMKHDIVQMEKSYASEMCTKVLIAKDYEDFMYPEYIINDPKAEWIGLALNDNHFIPMAEEIENCPADTSIYNKFERYYKRSYDCKYIFNAMLRGTHMRLSLNGKNINPSWDKQLPSEDQRVKYIFIHDKNPAAIKDINIIISDLLNRYGSSHLRIGFKFSPEIYDIDTLAVWSRVNKMRQVNNMNVHFIIPNEQLFRIALNPQQITYIFEPNLCTLEQVIYNLPNLFLQGMFLSRNEINLLLKFSSDFIVNQKWKDVLDFLSSYFLNCVYYRNNLLYSAFTYMKFCYNKISKEKKIELFEFVKQNCEDLFNYFYSVEYVNLQKGKLIPHMYSIKEFEQGGGAGGNLYQYRNSEENRPEQYNYSEYVFSDRIYIE